MTTAKRGRDGAEFREDVKRAIAAEAGYRCANPRCLAPTHAAGDNKQGEGKVGQASHISAAAKDFARWRPEMDPAVRRSAANGIWLCDVHGREIDGDADRFPEGLLHGWKRRARARAYASRGMQNELQEPRELIRHTAWLGDSTDRESISQFVLHFMADTGAHWLWADREHDAIRMTLYELILNAVEHGQASHLHLRARGYRIDLVYLGPDFNPHDLAVEVGNGGAEAMAHLRSVLADSLSVTYQHNGTIATIKLIDVSGAGHSQPCATNLLNLSSGWVAEFRFCVAVHVFIGGPRSFSDLASIGSRIDELVRDRPERRVVIHGLSEPLAESASKRLPNATVVRPRR